MLDLISLIIYLVISSRNNAKALPSVQQILKESSCRQEPNSHSTPSQYIIPKSLLLPSPPVNQIVQNIIPLPPLRCNDSKNTVMLKKEQPHQVIAQFIKVNLLYMLLFTY